MIKLIRDKEKLEILDKLLERINYHRTLTGNHGAAEAILKKVDTYWWETRTIHGETAKDRKTRINSALHALKELP